MARQVLTLRDISLQREVEIPFRAPGDPSVPSVTPKKDEYTDRLLKYIPAEVVACYIFVIGFIQKLTKPEDIKIASWVIFFLFCILTVWYLWKILKVRKVQQLVISLIAFIVWVFALGGPFILLTWYNPVYGEILLPVYTLVAAIWEAD